RYCDPHDNISESYSYSFVLSFRSFFFFTDTATTEIYTLSLHDALPISSRDHGGGGGHPDRHGSRRLMGRAGGSELGRPGDHALRSEEHTSELQSPYDLVCRLLLEKKKTNNKNTHNTYSNIHHTSHTSFT